MSAKPIRGTQSFNSFIPIDNNSLAARDVSCSEKFKLFVVIAPSTIMALTYQDVKDDSVIACAYEDGKWYLAKVIGRNDDTLEFVVHF